MLHAAETWAMKVDTPNHLQHYDCAMIRWIGNVKAKDEVSSDSRREWNLNEVDPYSDKDVWRITKDQV